MHHVPSKDTPRVPLDSGPSRHHSLSQTLVSLYLKLRLRFYSVTHRDPFQPRRVDVSLLPSKRKKRVLILDGPCGLTCGL